MIKFFRRIRQRLLIENSFSKYLLYALGEIILVVIGILIALQINNRNESRKQKGKNLVYLNQLCQEVDYNVLRSQFVLDSDSMKSIGNITVKETLDIAFKLDSFIHAGITADDIGMVWYACNLHYNSPRIQRTVYENGINTGALFDMDKPELLKEIQSYYALLIDDLEWMKASSSALKFDSGHLELLAHDFSHAMTDTDLGFMRQLRPLCTDDWTKCFAMEDRQAIIKAHPWIIDADSQAYKNLILFSRRNKSHALCMDFALTRINRESQALAASIRNHIERLKEE